MFQLKRSGKLVNRNSASFSDVGNRKASGSRAQLHAHQGVARILEDGPGDLRALDQGQTSTRVTWPSAPTAQPTARGRPARSLPIPTRFGGEARPVVLHARPAADRDQGFVLVFFEEGEAEELGV